MGQGMVGRWFANSRPCSKEPLGQRLAPVLSLHKICFGSRFSPMKWRRSWSKCSEGPVVHAKKSKVRVTTRHMRHASPSKQHVVEYAPARPCEIGRGWGLASFSDA